MKRKAISVILALVLCVSLAVPALAGGAGFYELRIYIKDIETPERFSLTQGDLVGDFVFTNEAGNTLTIPVSIFESSEAVDNALLGSVVFIENDKEFPYEILVEHSGTYTLTQYPELPEGYSFVTSGYGASYGGDPISQAEEKTGTPNFYVEIPPDGYWGMDSWMLSVTSDAAPVPETPSSWAAEQVNAAIAADLVPESLRSQYTQAATRAEFCALVVALYENIQGEITGRKEFTDTTDINVQKCAFIGVVTGTNTEQTVFSPDAQLTREQAAAMLHRLAGAMEYNAPLTQEYILWTDEDGISEYARSATQFVYKIGVMNGTGTDTLVFSPKGPYTREQSVVTILRLFDVLKSSQ